MSKEELKLIADQSNMIVKGYAFTYHDGNVSVLNLNRPDRALLISKDGKVLESNTDDITGVTQTYLAYMDVELCGETLDVSFLFSDTSHTCLKCLRLGPTTPIIYDSQIFYT